MKVSGDLLCLFSAKVEERDGSYVIEVPQQEVDAGTIEVDEGYRVAMLPARSSAMSDTRPATAEPARQAEAEPPVEVGEVLDVEIEDVGDQGDGIARVGPGYVVIVPETSLGERVAVEITETRENMAFAEVVKHYDR